MAHNRPIHMQSGMNLVSEPNGGSDTAKVYTICFLAVFMRRVLVEAYVYEYHHVPEVHRDEAFEVGVQSISKAAKYNLLCEEALGARLQPLIDLVIQHDGFVTPEDHRNNHYAMRAAEIFPVILNAYNLGGIPIATALCLKYAMAFLSDPSVLDDEMHPESDEEYPSEEVDTNEDANATCENTDHALYDDDLEPPADGNCHCSMCTDLDYYASLDLSSHCPKTVFEKMAMQWCEKMDNAAKQDTDDVSE